MERSDLSLHRAVGTMWVLTAGLLLVACAGSRGKSEASCGLLSARTVTERFGVEDVDVTVHKSSCDFALPGADAPFLMVSKSELGDRPLAALFGGDPVAGHGDEAIASAHGGPLGTAVAVRNGADVVRVDLAPTDKIGADGTIDAALSLAGRVPRGPATSASPVATSVPGSFCDRFAVIATIPGDGSALRFRPINAATCEATIEGRSGSLYIGMVMESGATPDDLERAAGRGATPVAVGTGGRWAPTSDGRGGSLWVLAGDRLWQVNAQDIDSADHGVGLSTAMANAVLESGGAG